MSALTDYAETQIITHLFRTGSFAKPATLYFALFTTLPVDAGTGGVEVSGTNYARVPVAGANANFNAPIDATPGRKTANTNAITFNAPGVTTPWGTVIGYGVFDSASGGNLLAYGTLTASKTIGVSDPAPEFPTGAFVFTSRLGTTALNDKIIDHIFRTTALTKPTNLYFSLYTTAPTDAGGGTELTIGTGGYNRVAVVPLDTNFALPIAGDGHTENSNAITFGTPSTAWGLITAVGVFDAATAGNLLIWASFTGVNVNSGDAQPKIAAGQFDYTVA
jgi:hypothetical protein